MLAGRRRALKSDPQRWSPGTLTCCLHHHPIAPTEFPKRMSVTESFGPETFRNCGMILSRGGYPLPITPGGGYQLRLTSKCLAVMIAIGQPSTDFIKAHQRILTGLLQAYRSAQCLGDSLYGSKGLVNPHRVHGWCARHLPPGLRIRV